MHCQLSEQNTTVCSRAGQEARRSPGASLAGCVAAHHSGLLHASLLDHGLVISLVVRVALVAQVHDGAIAQLEEAEGGRE